MQYKIFLEKMHMNPNCIIAMTRFVSDEPIYSSEKGNCLFMHLKRVFEGGVLEVMSDTIPCPGFGVNTGLISGFPKIPWRGTTPLGLSHLHLALRQTW